MIRMIIRIKIAPGIPIEPQNWAIAWKSMAELIHNRIVVFNILINIVKEKMSE